MCNLNSKGDLTINSYIKAYFTRRYPVFVISQLIFRILEKFFQLSTSLEHLKQYKKLGDLKL